MADWPASAQSAQNLKLGRGFTFQQNNDPKQMVKRRREYLINNPVNSLGWPSQSSDPISSDPITWKWTWEDLWEKWQKILKCRYAKFIASYPKRLEPLITAKGVSNKYCVKGINTCTYYSFSFLISLRSYHRFFYLFVITVYEVEIKEEKLFFKAI